MANILSLRGLIQYFPVNLAGNEHNQSSAQDQCDRVDNRVSELSILSSVWVGTLS